TAGRLPSPRPRPRSSPVFVSSSSGVGWTSGCGRRRCSRCRAPGPETTRAGAAAAAQDEAIDAAVAAAGALGVEEEAVPIGRDELAKRCSSPRFRRGVLYREGATVQPARLLRALRAAVLDEGVILHERTPMVRLRRGSPNVIEAPRGRIRAREVIVAINAAAAGSRPAARRLTAFGYYVVLTEPVPERLDRISWTGGESIIDARMFLHYFRTTNDGRVV